MLMTYFQSGENYGMAILFKKISLEENIFLHKQALPNFINDKHEKTL